MDDPIVIVRILAVTAGFTADAFPTSCADAVPHSAPATNDANVPLTIRCSVMEIIASSLRTEQSAQRRQRNYWWCSLVGLSRSWNTESGCARQYCRRSAHRKWHHNVVRCRDERASDQ